MTCRYIDNSMLFEHLKEEDRPPSTKPVVTVVDISDRTEFTLAQVKALAEYCGFEVANSRGVDLKNEVIVMLDGDTNKPKSVYFSEYPEKRL